jgi:hypothetical protein
MELCMSHPGASRSAYDDIGAHLLQPVGKRQTKDDRDYDLADYLTAHNRVTSSLSGATTLEDLKTVGPLDAWHDIYAFWKWFKSNIINTPTPAPTPPAGANEWQKLHGISDQGQTGHCVGFTGLDWGNTLAVDDAWANQKGHDIYYACKVKDGEPGQENGSYSRSLCKVLKDMGRIGAYAFTSDVNVLAEYVLDHGPIGIGIPWMNDMFNPDAKGLLHITGGEAGGHEVELNAFDTAGFGLGKHAFKLVNHWTDSWGINGCAYLLAADLQKLINEDGDAFAGLELPL